jgi:peptide subunit release factor 1 (eRF1)
MKLTLAIPENKRDIKTFITNELNSSNNIKSKQTRDKVQTGLRRLLNTAKPSHSYLYDGDKNRLQVFKYPFNEFVYYCGKKYKMPDYIPDMRKYLLITMDTKEYTLGLLQGKKLTVLNNDFSGIMGKHNKGGQSKARFQRERQHKIVCWFKDIADKTKEYVK